MSKINYILEVGYVIYNGVSYHLYKDKFEGENREECLKKSKSLLINKDIVHPDEPIILSAGFIIHEE